MRCPFLREEQVKYCTAYPVKKMILCSAEPSDEICTTENHKTCAAFTEHDGTVITVRCPFLHESLVQYCMVSPILKIPYNGLSITVCGNDSHKECSAYNSLANPITNKGTL